MLKLDPQKLHDARQKAGLSQSELARRAGISGPGLINALEHRNPTVTTLSKLAKVLGVEIVALLTDDEDEQPHQLAAC